MVYKASHTTRYVYRQPASSSLSEVRLTPRELPWQHLRKWHLDVSPAPDRVITRTDYFGNIVTTISLAEPHDSLRVTATSIVEVEPPQAVWMMSPTWEGVRDALAAGEGAEMLQASEFLWDSPFVPCDAGLAGYALPVFTPGRPLFEAALDLTRRIYRDFRYVPKSTSIETPLADVMAGGQGVCQDFAHVMIGSLRSLGLAARYVSGYLRSGSKYLGAEASHAWVSVYIPAAGWVPFDPTNNIIPDEGHVTLAWGRDYGDVTPLKGITLGGGGEDVEVEVRVIPVDGTQE